MNQHFRITSNDIKKLSDTISKGVTFVVKQIKEHPVESIGTGLLAGVTLDDIRQRFCRNKERKEYEKNTIKAQKVMCKHEAMIQIVKSENQELVSKNAELLAVNQQLIHVIIDGKKEEPENEQV